MNPSEIGELLLGNISAIQSLGLSPDRVTELEQDAYAVVRNVAQASTNTTAIKIVDLIGSYFKLDVAAELVLAPTADLAAEVECHDLCGNFTAEQMEKINASPQLLQLVLFGGVALVKIMLG